MLTVKAAGTNLVLQGLLVLSFDMFFLNLH